MGLKEEIERVVAAERQKLAARDQSHAEYHEVQRRRFQPMRALLEELAASVEPTYLEIQLDESSATLEVGDKGKQHSNIDIRWEIEPDYEIASPIDEGQGLFREKSGFRVDEKKYYYMPEYEVFESTRKFATEAEVAEYLIREIAKELAQYRHFADLRTKAQKQR